MSFYFFNVFGSNFTKRRSRREPFLEENQSSSLASPVEVNIAGLEGKFPSIFDLFVDVGLRQEDLMNRLILRERF